MKIFSTVISFIFIVVSSGCVSLPLVESRYQHALQIAEINNLSEKIISTKSFTITSFYKMKNPEDPVTLYIEGDGLAWLNRNQLSLDPTPKNPMALELAILDASPNVVYLARPCQFQSRDLDVLCEDSEYWSSKRFSQEVIDSMNQAISEYQAIFHFSEINLVGYSGGGAVAVIIASLRNDVDSLRTVAGNLDHDAVNEYHGVSKLDGSLNPADVAEQISRIPQIHFSGTKDKTVPFSIAQSYVNKIKNLSCVQVWPVDGVGHTEGWIKNWDKLSKISAECSSSKCL